MNKLLDRLVCWRSDRWFRALTKGSPFPAQDMDYAIQTYMVYPYRRMLAEPSSMILPRA